ncbi:MAG: hypothetical protein JWM53_1687 [bacterium]|nr:hypothetical protein [bacterium]
MRSIALLTLLTIGCGATGGGGSADGGSIGGDLALGANAVRLRNASITFDGSIYSIQFVVDDTAYPMRTIASIDGVSFLWPGGYADASAFHCTQPPWIVPAETTGTLDVGLGVGGSSTLLFVSCGVPNTQQPFYSMGMMPPASGDSILIEVDGKLDDATPFKAETAADTP